MDRAGCSNEYFSDTEVYKNNIRTNLADILKTDYALRRLLKKAGKTGSLTDRDLADAAAVFIEFHINNMAKLPAVLYINDLFFTKLTEHHRMTRPFSAFYIKYAKKLQKVQLTRRKDIRIAKQDENRIKKSLARFYVR